MMKSSPQMKRKLTTLRCQTRDEKKRMSKTCSLKLQQILTQLSKWLSKTNLTDWQMTLIASFKAISETSTLMTFLRQVSTKSRRQPKCRRP